MPPTVGHEWAVAQFKLDDMHSNDTHLRVVDQLQQYERFYFTLNGDVKPDTTLELLWIVVWRGHDTQAPTEPKPQLPQTEDGKTTLRWDPSSDNLAVHHYEVLEQSGNDWKPLSISTGTSLTLEGKANGVYGVKAVDPAGNASPLAVINLKQEDALDSKR